MTTSPNEIATSDQRGESAIRLMLTGVRPNAALNIALALALTFVAVFLIWIFARPIVLLLAGIIIAQALIPVVNKLSRRIPRGLAIATTYITLLVIIVVLSVIIIPSLVDQGQDLVDRAPELYEDGMTWVEDNELLPEEMTSDDVEEQVVGWISQFGGQLVGIPLTIVSTVADVILVIATSVYWLVAGPAMRRFALSLFPYERQGRVDDLLTEMGQTMGGYVRGIAMTSSLLALVTFIGLSIIGVEYALVLALIAGILAIIPIVGPVIATVPMVGIALLDSLTTGIIVLVFWVIIQQFENYVTMPMIMKRQAQIPPMIVLLALFWGGSVGGILGGLIAIPLAGALRVFFLRVVAPAMRRWTGAVNGETAGPPRPPASQQPG